MHQKLRIQYTTYFNTLEKVIIQSQKALRTHPLRSLKEKPHLEDASKFLYLQQTYVRLTHICSSVHYLAI